MTTIFEALVIAIEAGILALIGWLGTLAVLDITAEKPRTTPATHRPGLFWIYFAIAVVVVLLT